MVKTSKIGGISIFHSTIVTALLRITSLKQLIPQIDETDFRASCYLLLTTVCEATFTIQFENERVNGTNPKTATRECSLDYWPLVTRGYKLDLRTQEINKTPLTSPK